MERKWANKQVDLKLLTTELAKFIKERNFEAIKGESPTGFQIFAEHSTVYRFNECAEISVEGKPSDFKVSLVSCKKKRSLYRPFFMETMFFGGWLLNRRLRSEEDWLKFEKDFWRYADNAVLRLTNSSSRSVPTS